MIRHSLEGARPAGLSAFESLVYPLSPEAFFARVWQKEAMAIEAPPDPTLAIIDTDEFLEILFEAGVGIENIRYTHPAEPGFERNLDAFFRQKAAWRAPPTLGELAGQIAGGTLVFNMIAARSPRARAWCGEVFKATKCAIEANAYFGASEGASAFGAHFDNDDVFVIQLEGQKDWLVWDKPERGGGLEHVDCQPPASPPDHIVRLSRGDTLYLPKRRWHWPQTVSGGPSLHLTVQFTPFYPKDIVHWIRHLLESDAAVARGIAGASDPVGALSPGAGAGQAIDYLLEELASPDAKTRAELYLALRRMERMRPRGG